MCQVALVDLSWVILLQAEVIPQYRGIDLRRVKVENDLFEEMTFSEYKHAIASACLT